MAKKTGLRGSLFREIDPYAKDESGEAGERVIAIPIEVVRPDQDQPRRLLPADLSRAVASGEMTPGAAMQEWQRQASASEGPPAHNLQELHRLADSIEKQGLINPITVRRPRLDEKTPEGVEYVIVTGERRYWAHVLLATEGRSPQVNDQGQTLIRALESPEGVNVRAHQLIENIMREDINAVEKAEGLWALRHELSKVNYSSPHDEKASQKLVPWKTVSEILGISDRYRIYMTSVLKLPNEAQTVIEEHNLAEQTIRPIIQKLKGKPDLQTEALKQVVAWQEGVGSQDAPGQTVTGAVRELVSRLLEQEAAERGAAKAVEEAAKAVRKRPEAARFRRKVRGTIRYLRRLPEEDLGRLAQELALDANYTDVVDELQDLRKQIDGLLAEVSAYQSAEGNG